MPSRLVSFTPSETTYLPFDSRVAACADAATARNLNCLEPHRIRQRVPGITLADRFLAAQELGMAVTEPYVPAGVHVRGRIAGGLFLRLEFRLVPAGDVVADVVGPLAGVRLEHAVVQP